MDNCSYMEAVARQLILTRHRSVPQNERSMNKYSCGNDPHPGDVVEVVNAKEIKGEDFLFIMAAGIKLGNTHTVNDISVNGQIRVGKVYHIHPSRFRLIRRAGEQPQPDMAKMLEEKEREIERLKEQVNDLKMDAAAHEYNEIERLRYQEEYERQLLEEKDEAIRELRAGLEDILTINPSPPNTEK